MKTPANFEPEVTIKEVTEGGDYYSITTSDSWGMGVDKKYGVKPKVGDKISIRGGFGLAVVGMKINGQVLYDKTDAQVEQERLEWLANYKREKEERFQKSKLRMDADFAALPDAFQKRIQKFRDNNPDFRVDYEAYELFTCKEAVKIAKACKTPEEVERFAKLDYDGQKKLANIDDGHSGNTIGAATALAYWFLKESGNVVKMNGALSPLVGSDEYGDAPKGGKPAKRNSPKP